MTVDIESRLPWCTSPSLLAEAAGLLIAVLFPVIALTTGSVATALVAGVVVLALLVVFLVSALLRALARGFGQSAPVPVVVRADDVVVGRKRRVVPYSDIDSVERYKEIWVSAHLKNGEVLHLSISGVPKEYRAALFEWLRVRVAATVF